MTATRVMAAVLALLALPALGAQVFSADEFFGHGMFVVKDKAEPRRGSLLLPLSGEPLPAFVDLSRSGDGRVADCHRLTETGMLMTPGERESFEARVDAGFSSAEIGLKLVELDRGATLAVQIAGRDDGGRYLAEFTHQADGSVRLRLRAFNRGRFTEMPGTVCTASSLEPPLHLSLKFDAEGIEVSVAGLKATAKVKLPAGATCGVAVSDGRARISRLVLAGTLEPGWMREAAARLQARKALERLREYATLGLMHGIARAEHPGAKADLTRYDEAAAAARKAALENTSHVARRDGLLRLAEKLPDVALARHDAGLACLLAGDPARAREQLEAADKLAPAPVTRLALAEALRRLRQFSQAEQTLAAARRGLPADLEPDHELLRGRLAAARGDIRLADAVLSAAARRWPQNDQLAAFAESAAELTSPRGLTALKAEGPLGLAVLSDLPEASSQALNLRLKPYIAQMRIWRPGVAEKLKGAVVLYSEPDAYLRAALLLAADNLDNVAGMFVPAALEGLPTVIACRAFGEDELLRTLVHELWHLCYAASGVRGDLPAWLNEGMAVFLSAGMADKDGVLAFDHLPAEFEGMQADLKRMLADETRVLAMLAAGRDSFYLPENLRMNYAAAWALARRLALGGIASAETLRKLLARELDDQQWLKEHGAALVAQARQSLDKLK